LESLFKALADPTRRRILELLKNGSMTAGDIADAFDIGKPSISHHLNILKAADLVQSERDGQNIVYTLNTSVFQELVAWVYGLKKEDKPE
jgi:DNA-binding transcriptional ArsR family regulator